MLFRYWLLLLQCAMRPGLLKGALATIYLAVLVAAYRSAVVMSLQ